MGFIVPFIPLLVGAGTAATTVYATKSASKTNRSAAQAEQDSIDKQLAYEREKEAERKAEWEREQAEAKLQWEAAQKQADEDRAFTRSTYADTLNQRRAEFEFEKQKYAERRAQMAPYRQAGAGALAQLAQLAGVSGATAAEPQVLAEMPENWQPGDPVTATPAAGPSSGEADRSLLDNPNLLPTSLTATGTKATTSTPAVSLPVTLSPSAPVAPDAAAASSFRDVSTQRLAAPTPAAPAAPSVYTPAQVEAAWRAGQMRGPSLSDLIRARKARV